MTLKQKRQKLRQYAIKIGLCGNCLKKDKYPQKASCDYCLKKLRELGKRRRKNPLNCSRCGVKRQDLNFKTCLKCRLTVNKK